MKENKKSVSTRQASSHCKASKEKQEDFIMLPTVDFCFKELMQNDNIRKNIIAIRAGYHFSNHAVKSPINIGIRLFTRISTFPNPAFLNRKVQIAVSTYSVPHAAARI